MEERKKKTTPPSTCCCRRIEGHAEIIAAVPDARRINIAVGGTAHSISQAVGAAVAVHGPAGTRDVSNEIPCLRPMMKAGNHFDYRIRTQKHLQTCLYNYSSNHFDVSIISGHRNFF